MPIPTAVPFPTALPDMRGELGVARIRASRPARVPCSELDSQLASRAAGSCDDDGAPRMTTGAKTPKANRDACCDTFQCVNTGVCTDWGDMLGTCCNDVELVPKTYNLDTVAVEWSSRQGSITKPAVEWNLAHLLELEAGACVAIGMNEYYRVLSSRYGAACASDASFTPSMDCIWPDGDWETLNINTGQPATATSSKAWIKLEVCDSVRLERARTTPRQNLLAAIRTPHTAYHRFASALAAMD